MAGDAQIDRLSGAQTPLPTEGCGAAAQLVEVFGMKFAEAHEDATGGAQVQVGAVKRQTIAAKGDAAWFNGLGCLAGQQTTLHKFIGAECRQARSSDRKKIEQVAMSFHVDACQENVVALVSDGAKIARAAYDQIGDFGKILRHVR
ncbi:MAG: hypothetical protein BroJett021_20580 [Chloroflexota bacterium]|nr:MAG: hypothetical protein BroJett021_20580 [Chloroflexota bacterium]